MSRRTERLSDGGSTALHRLAFCVRKFVSAESQALSGLGCRVSPSLKNLVLEVCLLLEEKNDELRKKALAHPAASFRGGGTTWRGAPT